MQTKTALDQNRNIKWFLSSWNSPVKKGEIKNPSGDQLDKRDESDEKLQPGADFKRQTNFESQVSLCVCPVWGRGTPLPLVHLLPHIFPFLLFPFFPWLYLFSSFVHPFPFYQNSPTLFPEWRS